MPDKRELEKVANKWRKDNPDLRTKVLCRNGEMILLTKEKEDKKYTKTAKETLDLELQALDDLPQQQSRPASPIPSQPATIPTNRASGRGRGGDRGRGAFAGRNTPKSSKRPRTEYDFSRFIAD